MSSTRTIADAKNRAGRTLWQGLGIDVGIAVLGALSLWIVTDDPFSKPALAGLAVLVVKSVLQAALAYVARIKITPATEPEGGVVRWWDDFCDETAAVWAARHR